MEYHAYFSSVLQLTDHYPQAFTATIAGWKPLLKPQKYKDLIISSLSFLSVQKRIKVFAFVIMDNHLHIMWQIQPAHKREEVQRDFLTYTAQSIMDDLKKHHPAVPEHFKADEKDPRYRIWKRGALTTDLFTHAVLMQKLEYIPYNAVKAGLCTIARDYPYSSASYYENNKSDYTFLCHYTE